MSDTPDLRAQVMREFRQAIEDALSWTPYEAVERHRDEVLDAVEAAWPNYVRRLMSTIETLRDRLGDTTRERDAARADYSQLAHDARGALDAVQASRRDWAAEAAAMDYLAERMLTFHSQNEDRLSFVARRYLSNGSGLNFRPTGCTGISSDALAWYAVGKRKEPKLSEYPADEGDLARCERTYEMAPEFLRERMLPVLERYRAHVAGSAHPDSSGGAQ